MQNPDSKPLLSIVSPCYNEEAVAPIFYAKLKSVLDSLSDMEHEILFVDDGSQDGTLQKLNELAAKDSSVQVYSLSRNFGHQAALLAGIHHARGQAVILLDSDLQHPPELIVPMIAAWKSGYEIVSAVRQQTAQAGYFKKLSSRFFYWFIGRISDTEITPGVADFSLLSARARSAICEMPERHLFLRGMISWIGFNRYFIPYEAAKRAAGTSKYSLAKMWRLSADAIFSFSTTPIHLATRMGLCVTCAAGLYLAYILFSYLFLGNLVRGWPSMIASIMLIGGSNMLVTGLIGEYLARVFEQVKGRPLYLLKQAPPQQAVGASRQGMRRVA